MDHCHCCSSTFQHMSRRSLLKRAAGMAATALAANMFPLEVLLPGRSYAATNAGKTLVVIFQRGGNDGLNTIVPYTDPQYYAARPRSTGGGIGIPPPGSGDGAGLDLPGTGFAMHPSILPLHSLFTGGRLAIVTAVGFAGSTQSHFTDQDTIEHGFFQLRDGWLNRYLAAVPAAGAAAMRAASIGDDVAKSLRGSVLVPSLTDLASVSFTRLGQSRATLDSNFRAIYAQDPASTSTNPARNSLHALGPDMLARVAAIEGIGPAAPQNGATYPATTFGREMWDLAHIIRSGLGLEVATVDIGGWDTHDDQGGGGTAANRQAGRLADFAGGIRAFVDDLGPLMSNVVLLTCTEFGRTVRQNASGGTDHGKASTWFLIGGSMKGGLYHGAAGWPGSLADANLDSGRYLRATVEFRDLYADVLSKHFGVGAGDLAAVFPGYTHTPVGLFA
ncbi:hypothetical protein NITMOv2_2374 [Nitrospira moscoviensis]|uniref:DUF1501 domain-containing protein n=2 Tax=Nitrospira moscoviensis TaxID=42253 RepID=A0A0K2GD47_NITMO|nr:hypothetical protein NITMOv2_2374 [Nitrospira moscoviensis]